MIKIIIKNVNDHTLMDIELKGDAESIAQEYAALTLKLSDEFPIVLDRAQWYLDDIMELREQLRKEVDND